MRFTVNYSECLNMLNVSTLLLYNISKMTTPFVNAAVNEALQQLVPFFRNFWMKIHRKTKNYVIMTSFNDNNT